MIFLDLTTLTCDQTNHYLPFLCSCIVVEVNLPPRGVQHYRLLPGIPGWGRPHGLVLVLHPGDGVGRDEPLPPLLAGGVDGGGAGPAVGEGGHGRDGGRGGGGHPEQLGISFAESRRMKNYEASRQQLGDLIVTAQC